MSNIISEVQSIVASNSQNDSIIVINSKKAVATKSLISGFGTNKSAFLKMWARNEDEFVQGKDWDWFNQNSGQIVTCRNNNPVVTRIFWTTGVSKASTKFTSPKAKEFAQEMFDNYGSQLDGETKLVKSEHQNSFTLPQNYKEALQELLNKVEENEKLTLENEEMKPKANYFDITINQNPENFSVLETTNRFLNQEKGISISDKKVWEIMRESGWIIYQKKSINSKNQYPFPSQKTKDKNWLTTTESKNKVIVNKETGEIKEFTNTQILVTPNGRLKLLQLVQKSLTSRFLTLL